MSISLNSPNESIRLTTSSTSEITYTTTYQVTGKEDYTTSTQGLITSITTTTIIAAPSANFYYAVTDIAFVNTGGVDNTIEVKKVVSGVDYPLFAAITLSAGDSLEYSSANGWKFITATGQIPVEIDKTGLATSAKQDTSNTILETLDLTLTDNSQKTQIVDAGGDAVSVTGGKLDVNAVNATASSGTITSVASSVSSVTLLALNTSRLGASIYNDSLQTLYLKLGATASAASFTVKISSNGYYELPTPVYTGIIDGIWDVASGNARITELT